MSEQSVEAMKAELLAAGYDIDFNEIDSYAFARTPDDEWECVSFPQMPINRPISEVHHNVQQALNEVATTAHKHLSQQRELAALREFVEKVANIDLPTVDRRIVAKRWHTEAKKLSSGKQQED